jgi:dihydrofolate reductase
VSVLSYGVLCSLDGYVEDVDGGFGWAEPDEEVHAFVNEQERSVGTYLYGRRMWDTMRWWGTEDPVADPSPVVQEYAAIWRDADKVVVSSTLTDVDAPRTRLERPLAADAVRGLTEAADRDLSIGGPALAAGALAAGLVDEVGLFLVPVAVGSGKPALPDSRLRLDLLEERRFAGGTVFLRYAVR